MPALNRQLLGKLNILPGYLGPVVMPKTKFECNNEPSKCLNCQNIWKY